MLGRRALNVYKRCRSLMRCQQLQLIRKSHLTTSSGSANPQLMQLNRGLFQLGLPNLAHNSRRTLLTLPEKLKEFERDVRASRELKWGYDKETGPDTWCKTYPIALGKRQSPINIPMSVCRFDKKLENCKFEFSYKNKDCVIMINTGFSWRIGVTCKAISTLRVGFLPDRYQLQQVHSHWCCGSHDGSEHLVDGKGYASEVHIVHFNRKYETFWEAINHRDGILVLGVFVEEGPENSAFDGILAHMDAVSFKSDTSEMPEGFDVMKLIPSTKEFWSYKGSLTNPPCLECVKWIVFRQPITISRRQLDIMRQLHIVDVEHADSNPTKMSCIVRPPQPLYDRVIRTSFRCK